MGTKGLENGKGGCFWAVVFAILLASASFAHACTMITVTSPNGGETYYTGKHPDDQWTYTEDPGTELKIQLLKGKTVKRTLTANVPVGSAGSGSYVWTIPSNLVYGGDYKIRVSSKNNKIKDGSDSDFVITPASCFAEVPSPLERRVLQ